MMFSLLCSAVMLQGCAPAHVATASELAATHPASVHAAEAKLLPPTATLAIGQMSLADSDSVRKHAEHKKTTKADSAQKKSVIYTCPMDPEVVQNEPGQCPKCGMKLQKKEINKEAPAKTDTTKTASAGTHAQHQH